MDSTLFLAGLSQAYSDTPNTSSPLMKEVDWASRVTVSVSNPKTESYKVPAGTTQSIFSGSRTTTVDNTTLFTLSQSTLAANRYRLTVTSGTAAGLTTDRSLTLNTHSVTVTANSNQTATFASAAASFSAVQVGDTVFIPGTTTGDSSGPFNALNEGLWTVLSVAGDGSSIQVARQAGATFTAYGQTVTVTANSQLIAFVPNVQVGDQVTISAGLPASVQKTFTVAALTTTWFEFVSTAALPVSATGQPGNAGIQFYTQAKRYLRILADQECVPHLNGDATSINRMSPWAPADMTLLAEFVKTGPTWSLTIQNISQSVLNVVVISAE